MNLEMVIAFLGLNTALFGAGWAAMWWRLGRMEGKMHSMNREWSHLKARCPLCSEK